MGIAVLALIIIALSGSRLYFNRQSFLSGMLLAFGVLVLGMSLLLFIVGIIIGAAPNSAVPILIFTFVGILGLLVVSGIALIINFNVMSSKEGRSLTAQLSLFFGLNLVILALLAGGLLFYGDSLPKFLQAIFLFALMTDLTFTFIFVCYLFYSYFYQFISGKNRADYTIILGAGVRSLDVSPLLKSRLDKAIDFSRETNSDNKMVPSGGQGTDEPVSEAAAMSHYLESQGIEANRIILEDKSRSTYENFVFSKKKILADLPHDASLSEQKIVFSTSNYHVVRGLIFAHKAGLKVTGIGAPTSFYFLPSAMLREYAAILSIYRIFTGLVVVFWLIASFLLLF